VCIFVLFLVSAGTLAGPETIALEEIGVSSHMVFEPLTSPATSLGILLLALSCDFFSYYLFIYLFTYLFIYLFLFYLFISYLFIYLFI
jgi:hypothetical protein